ncbi:MAG: archaellin/type IV pilin N-terminal domain-containing protein [Nitrosopumilaceae archaeon]
MRRSNHRAVAPIIATLLLVAIAVVGGTIIFVFSQGFFSQSQISGTPTIESVKILGYDARDVNALDAHDGVQMAAGTGGDPNVQGKNVDEGVVVYIKNDSVGQILFSEIRFGGDVYTYGTETPISAWNSAGNISPGNYGILTNATSLVQNQAPVAKPGETVGIMIDLNDNFPIGRDTQFKLTTTNGAVFVGTVVMGQNAG